MESIDPRRLLLKVALILKKLGIPYAVTGGMAVFVWAKPRFTADIDIIILLRHDDIESLTDELLALSRYSYIDKDAIRDAFGRFGEFNFVDGASGIKVDFWILKKDGFGNSQISRRISRQILGKKVYFISPEDLILNKLRWAKDSGSEFQLRDVESVMKFQKKLDLRYLRKWAKAHSTLKTLELSWKKSRK